MKKLRHTPNTRSSAYGTVPTRTCWNASASRRPLRVTGCSCWSMLETATFRLFTKGSAARTVVVCLQASSKWASASNLYSTSVAPWSTCMHSAFIIGIWSRWTFWWARRWPFCWQTSAQRRMKKIWMRVLSKPASTQSTSPMPQLAKANSAPKAMSMPSLYVLTLFCTASLYLATRTKTLTFWKLDSF